MGETGEGVEVFKTLFGEFSGSLSLFTNNPFQRRNTAGIAGAANQSDSQSEPRKKAGSKESVKKEKKHANQEETKDVFGTDASVQPAEHKKKLKKLKNEVSTDNAKSVLRTIVSEDKPAERERKETVGDANGVSVGLSRKVKRKDAKGKSKEDVKHSTSPFKRGKTSHDIGDEEIKRIKKKSIANETEGRNGKLEKGASKGDLNQAMKEVSLLYKEKEKLRKRKVIEELEEEFEKRLRGSDGKKVKKCSVLLRTGPPFEDAEIDEILEENKKQGKRKFTHEADDEVLSTKKKKTKKDFEEEEKRLLRTVFVGNLPSKVKKKHVIREFSQFGKVETARLRSVAVVDTKLPRKAAVITGQLNDKRTSQNAYVVFEDEKSASSALVHNMSEFQGKHIRVDMATAPRKDIKPGINNASEYDRTRSIFVGNVPFNVEDEDLHSVFANDNPELGVEAIRVPRDPQTSISKGFGFVLFKTKAGATAALAKKSVKLGDRVIRVVRMGSEQRLKRLSGPAAPSTGSSKDISGATRRISVDVASTTKKGPLPWEGARSAKLDGRPGKYTLARQDSKHLAQGSVKSTGNPAPKVRLTKRPAVAARKQAALVVKTGGVPATPKSPKKMGVKRKNAEKGRKGSLKAKKAKK